MGRRGVLFLVVCCLNGLLAHLNAETVTYDFSSTKYWVITSNGTTHPGTGSETKIQKIYYTANNDCFVGSDNVYFSNDGYLALNTSASLKIPYRDNWTISKVILHSHSGNSSSTVVNIFSAYDTKLSKEQKWSPNGVYEYTISPTNLKELYIKAKDAAARIISITIDYASADGGNNGAGDKDNPTGDDENDKEEEFVVSAPVFNPPSTFFSTESLNVEMDAAEGCDIYYTKNGSTPSYVSAEEYNGIKGNSVTIYASDSKVTLQTIAVDPATGKCSNVSSATYTYVEVKNDGESKAKAYTVAELRTKVNGESDKWVKGTICGAFDENNKILVTSNITINTNVAIGDEGEYVVIQLPKGNIRDEMNLKDHPYMLGKELLVKGDLESYMLNKGVGVKSPAMYEVFYDLPINSYGYSTLYLDMPVSVPNGTIAYYCTIEDNYAELHPVGSIIPSNMGVIIKSAIDKVCTFIYTTRSNSNAESILEENLLVGFLEDTEVKSDGSAYYALNVKDNRLGFYIPQTATDKTDAASGFMAKAYKSYLQVPIEQKAKMFIMHHKNDESSILSVTHIEDERIYDLQGRVITSPTAGVYIVGGRKIVIKD